MWEAIMTLAMLYTLCPEAQYNPQPTLTNGDKVVEVQVELNEPVHTYICNETECRLVE